MKLFLAWSGSRSYELAKALVWCIREVLPQGSVTSFLSSDITMGTLWPEALDRALRESDAVLLCVTRENSQSPWMHFEVGSRVGADAQSPIFTYLLDARPEDLTDPLRKYQSADCTKESTLLLLEAISGQPQGSLNEDFERCWPELERKVLRLKCFSIHELVPDFERLFQRKTFHEPMDECADQNWLDRYYGARQTLDKLAAVRDAVDVRWQPYQTALLYELISNVDAYVREMRRFLITESQFKRGQDGKLDLSRRADPLGIPAGDPRWSDKRCARIRELVAQLSDPHGAPVLSESLFFLSLSAFWQKKDFVQRREAEIESRDFMLKEYERSQCARSSWDFDRIVSYLTEEYATAPAPLDRLIKQVHSELERLEARQDRASAMPLNYGLRALIGGLAKGTASQAVRKDAWSCSGEVLALIDKKGLDEGGHLRRKVARLRQLTAPASELEDSPMGKSKVSVKMAGSTRKKR